MNKLYLLSLLGIKGAYLNVISENIEKIFCRQVLFYCILIKISPETLS